jgi:Holliday junction resolvasome RuvABC endonuclease subunit
MMNIQFLNGDDNMRVLGIDPSLSGTAFVLKVDGKVEDYWFFTDVVRTSRASDHAILNKASGIERLNRIYDFYMQLTRTVKFDRVGIENYAFGAKSNSVFQIGGCGELLRLHTYRSSIPYKEYEPSVVKKFGTGDGTAQKSQMVLAAFKEGFDVSEYGKNGEDLADAFWIATLVEREFQIRRDFLLLDSMTKKEKEVWTATSKKNPIPMIDRPFVGGD